MAIFEEDVDVPIGGSEFVPFNAPFLAPPRVMVSMPSHGPVSPYVWNIRTTGCVVGLRVIIPESEGAFRAWLHRRRLKKYGVVTVKVTATP